MSFAAEFPKSRFFLQTLQHLASLCDAAHLTCSPEGVRVQAIDVHQVAVATLAVDRSDFTSFACAEGAFERGFSIASALSALSGARGDEPVSFRGARDGLFVTLGAIGATERRLLEAADAFPLDIPARAYAATCVLRTRALRATFGALASLSDEQVRVKVTVVGNVVRFDAAAAGGGSGACVWLETLDAAVGRAESVVIAATYMHLIAKACCAERVTLRLTRDQPVSVRCALFTRTHLEFHLSPITADADAGTPL